METEVDFIAQEDLEAASQMFEELVSNTFYSKQEISAQEIGLSIKYIGE